MTFSVKSRQARFQMAKRRELRSSFRARRSPTLSPTSSESKFGKAKFSREMPRTPDRGVLKNKILPLGHQAIEANVYKDKSWFDGKECIVLDYSKTSLIAKKIRDEIREIQPGFYLGIVYWGKKRTIGFALEFPTSRT